MLESKFEAGEWSPFVSSSTEIKKLPSKATKKKDNENSGGAKDKEDGVAKKRKANRVAKKKKEPGKVLLLTDYCNSDFIAGHIINVGGLPKVFILWFTHT